MKFSHLTFVVMALIGSVGCSSSGPPGVPQPMKVLENPATGDRVRFFGEVPIKVPAGYDEKQHIANWLDEQRKNGFTKEIEPVDDRDQLAELRRKNLSARPNPPEN